jgi:flagellar L-ring protein FlgH
VRRKAKTIRRIGSALAALAVAGCVQQPIVHQPMTARPVIPEKAAAVSNGAIYQGRTAGLFEDRRARRVGDTLTVVLEENTRASKESSTTVSKSASVDYGIDSLAKLPQSALSSLGAAASSNNDFDGSGDSSSRNLFTGSVTVTVVEELPNGNLLVSGEKQVAINREVEFVRLSGVVNPVNITAQNTVSSTQIADARMEYRGAGPTNEAQIMGWLGRLFLSVMPF